MATDVIPFPESQAVRPQAVQVNIDQLYASAAAARSNSELYQRQFDDAKAREVQAKSDAEIARVHANNYAGELRGYVAILASFGLPATREEFDKMTINVPPVPTPDVIEGTPAQ